MAYIKDLIFNLFCFVLVRDRSPYVAQVAGTPGLKASFYLLSLQGS
jgi:hypothetical protein